MTLRLQNRIGAGKEAAPATFEVRSPSDGELIAIAPRSGAAEIARAVEAASAAFPRWRDTPAPARGELLLRAGRVLEARKDEIARLMAREMGKRLEEARGDVQEAIDTAAYAATEGRRLFGRTAPSELPNKFGMTVRRPVGVAGVITGWNFPVAVPSWKILTALVCGNTVVWKPAEESPASGDAFAGALEEAGLPAGVLNVVHGADEAGSALVAQAGVDLVSFTGSTEVGRQIAQTAGRTLKRVSLEMGGKNPVIVLPDADLDLAVDGLLWGAFGTAGPRCTATSRLIAVGDVAKELLPRLIERARALRLGDPLDPATEVGPLVSERQLRRVHGFVETAAREGGALLCGGARAEEGRLARGFFYLPTIVDSVRPGSTLALQEVFGPVLAVLRARSADAAIAIANEVEYGLSSSIYTRDVSAAFRAIERIDAGITYVNAPTIGAAAPFPFGGVKQTGNGHR